jgi:lipoprotein-anchoring transpeptidase ErfK/SrfK
MRPAVPTRFRRLLAVALVAAAAAFAPLSPAFAAAVQATIDLSSQRMTVTVGGKAVYTWAVSTGRKGYSTPTGSYRPTRMYKRYFSKKYHGSPMPHSIFFRGGYAIHGTGYTKQLGSRASHGCVRLAPGNAAALYALVNKHGARNTRIVIRQ